MLNISEYRHNFNGILIGTYTRPTQQCDFKWPWMILSDLAKCSVKWSVAQSLCDSWASCCIMFQSRGRACFWCVCNRMLEFRTTWTSCVQRSSWKSAADCTVVVCGHTQCIFSCTARWLEKWDRVYVWRTQVKGTSKSFDVCLLTWPVTCAAEFAG